MNREKSRKPTITELEKRSDVDRNRIHPPGNILKIVIKPPKKFSQPEFEAYYTLVLASGQVSIIGLRGRIQDAFLLGYCFHDGTIVSTAALKNPTTKHKNEVFLAAGVQELSTDFDYELGYAYTLLSYRGRHICSNLIAQLLKSTNRVYATTGNQSMVNILKRNGFVKIGKSFVGINNPLLELYVVR